MRYALAALTDVVFASLVGYLAFRAAAWTAHCGDEGECVILTPLIVLFVVAGLGVYFGLPMRRLGQTVGQRIFRVERDHELGDDNPL